MLAAVVLAAGAAERFGSPKQRLLLPAVLARVRATHLDDVVVVAGAYELDLEERTVECPEWELGPGASLRCGLAALRREIEAAIVVLADGPEALARRDRARRSRVARHRRSARRGLVRRLAWPPAARRAGALGRRAGPGVARPRAAARPV